MNIEEAKQLYEKSILEKIIPRIDKQIREACENAKGYIIIVFSEYDKFTLNRIKTIYDEKGFNVHCKNGDLFIEWGI